MSSEIVQVDCPRAGIAAYLDGELSASDELALELHFAGCPTCTNELNTQKNLLNALDFALEPGDEIELPADFTKVVVANAESGVRGFRCPRERGRALMVIASLLLIVGVGLGAETSRTFATIGQITDQIVAVASFFGRFLHDAAIAVAMLLRSFSDRFVLNSAASSLLLALFFGASLLIFSRLMSRHGRS